MAGPVASSPAVLGWRQLFMNAASYHRTLSAQHSIGWGRLFYSVPHTADYELGSRLNDGKSIALLPEHLVAHRCRAGIGSSGEANRLGTLQIMQRSIAARLQPVAWAEIEALAMPMHAQPSADPELVGRVAWLLQALCDAYVRHARLSAAKPFDT
ncbi:MAG: hypothetical protein U0175_20095 [Caldilineaceae bacterium]